MTLITADTITSLLQSKLEEEHLFVVEISVSEKKHINVYLDGMENIAVSQCASLSRYLREALGEDGDDYQITVSSPGLDRPFRHPMQYTKNLEKSIEVVMNDGQKIAGKLVSVEAGKSISVQEFEPIKGNNKSQKPKLGEKITIVPLDQIKETRKLIFI